MTFEDRVNAITGFGFTERQSRFLVTVMLHSGACLMRFAYAKAAFSAPRYRVLYPRWLKEGEVGLEAVSCNSIADAITRGAGRVESIVLPHQYRHLSPLVLGGDLRRVPEDTRRQMNEIKQTPDEMGAPS